MPRSILATCILPFISPLLQAATETWVPTAAGTFNWDTASNWSPATVPNAVGELALMNSGITGPQTILFNQAITLGTLSLQGSTVQSTTFAAGTAGSLTLQAATGNAQINFLSSNTGAWTNIISAPVILGSSLDITNGLSGVRGTLNFSGGISESGGARSIQISRGGGGISYGGAVVFSGTNSYTGSTTLDRARLILDYATANTNKLSDTAALNLNGGVLRLAGNATGATTEQINGLNLGEGSSKLEIVTAGQNVTFSLGALTRTGLGALDFAPTTTAGGTAAFTTTTANTNGILNGAFTFNGTDWAANDGTGQIGAFSGYSTGSLAAGVNALISSNTSGTDIAIHSLKITGGTTTLAGTDNVIASGGILGTGTTKITGGSLTSGNGRDLIIHSTGSIELASALRDNGATPIGLTLGSGNVTLSGNNTYTGGTVLGNASLTLSHANALGTGELRIKRYVSDTNLYLRLPADGVIPNNITYDQGFHQNIALWQRANNNTTFSGVLGYAAGQSNGLRFLAIDNTVTSGQITLLGNNTTLGGVASLENLSLTLGHANAIGSGGASITIGSNGTGTSASEEWGSSKLYLLNGVTAANQVFLRSIKHSDNTGPALHLGMATAGAATFSGTIYLGSDSSGITAQRTVNFEAADNASVTFSGQIRSHLAGNDMPVRKIGNGTVVFSNAGNIYTGATTVLAGILQAKSAGSLPAYATQTYTVSGGTLAVNAGAASGEWTAGQIDGFLANPNLTFATGAAFGINTSGGDFSYGTALTKANVGLLKLGANTLTLSGANTFTGATNISGGTLALSNVSALAATSGISLGAGTTLSYTGGSATLDRAISVSSGTGTLRNTGGGTLTLSGALTKDGSVLTFGQGGMALS